MWEFPYSIFLIETGTLKTATVTGREKRQETECNVQPMRLIVVAQVYWLRPVQVYEQLGSRIEVRLIKRLIKKELIGNYYNNQLIVLVIFKAKIIRKATHSLVPSSQIAGFVASLCHTVYITVIWIALNVARQDIWRRHPEFYVLSFHILKDSLKKNNVNQW